MSRTNSFAAVCVSLLAGAVLAGLLYAQEQPTVRIHGAATLGKLIGAKADEIGTKHSVKVVAVGNSSGRGLEDLLAGRADVAAIGGSLTGVAAAVNAKTPGAVKAENLKEFTVLKVDLKFVVHPSNTVTTLTPEQAKGLLSGTVKNWKEIGGPDVPVVVVTPQELDGSRVTLQTECLKDAKYTADARVLQVAPDVPKVVGQIPGGVGVISAAHVTPAVKTLKMEKDYVMPLCLVTNGEPKDPVKSVISTIQSTLGGDSATASTK